MIQVGTLCYIVGDHCRAGRFCTVTGAPPRYGRIDRPDGPLRLVYIIELSSGERPWLAAHWGAEPHQLIPIAPPGILERERDKASA